MKAFIQQSICTLSVLMLSAAQLKAEDSDVPKFIDDGFSQYVTKGPAIVAITWGLDTSHAVVKILDKAEKTLGEYERNELLLTNALSKRSAMAVFALNYKTGILFLKFNFYKTMHEWLLLDVADIAMPVMKQIIDAENAAAHMENMAQSLNAASAVMRDLNQSLSSVYEELVAAEANLERNNKALEKLGRLREDAGQSMPH